MTTVRVHFTVQYTDCNLSVNETHPSVTCFLSAHLKRDYTRDVAEIKLNPSDTEATQQVSVSGFLSERVRSISSNAALCFASYAWSTNDAGVECRADAGIGDVSLADISAARPSKSRPFVRDIPLVMHTVGNRHKGTIRVSVHHLDTGRLLVDAPLIGVETAVVNDLKRYYTSLAAQRKDMGDAIRGTENVDAPYNFSESGFNTPYGPMPLLGYMMHELPQLNTNTLKHLSALALHRDGMRESDWHLLNRDGRLRATISMLTTIPTYSDYLADVVQTDSRKDTGQIGTGVKHEAPAEKFGARMGDAGDCEDFAEQIVQIHEAFNGHQLPQNTSEHAVLRDMQRISRQLVSYTTLAIVNGQQVAKQAHLGAHMYALFEGWPNWKERLEQTEEGRRISAQLPYPRDIDQMERFPLVMGEGTGIYENMGYATDLSPIMGAVNALPSLALFKKPIWHPRGQQIPFYIGSVLGVTGYFARRGSPYGTWNMTNGAEGKRGVLIDDMISGDNARFGMRMHPKLNRRILNAISEAAAKRAPVPPLTLSDTFVETATTHPQLTRVCDTVASWNRPTPARHVAIPVYARPYQLTERVASAMIADFQRAKHIYKVTQHLERITDDMYGYRVMIHVNTDR